MKAEALDMLHSWEGEYHTYAVFGLFEANSEGDDIWLEGQKVRFPMLRQQHPAAQENLISVWLILSVLWAVE